MSREREPKCRSCFRPVVLVDVSTCSRNDWEWRHVDPADEERFGSHRAEALVFG